MARIEDLVGEIHDARLRDELHREIKKLKQNKKFGLVFEEHLPETVRLPSLPFKIQELVAIKKDPSNTLWRITQLNGKTIDIQRDGGIEKKTLAKEDLIAVRRFGEPIYPALIPVESIARGGDKPWHTIIEADNYHALQLLLYCYEESVDLIYIDPPYNTGARDWKYNNDYVDDHDMCQHSKWLSFMQRRLTLAKRLLKPDGVAIITIDQNEVHRLGVLLDQLFPEYERTMITITIHGRGNAGTNFDRVEEFAFFLVPPGPQRIQKRKLNSYNSQNATFGLVADTRTFVRTGNNSTPDKRPGMDYPIWVNSKGEIRIGDVHNPQKPRYFKPVGDETPVWPIDERGHARVWRRNPAGAQKALSAGHLQAIFDPKNNRWRLRVTNMKSETINHRTVWADTSHAAKNHGTSLLTDILGAEKFSFPKSLYAVRDCLAAVVAQKKNALILDFFAGSGTTLNAVNLLNAVDGGTRRCILVTNNEVSANEADSLLEKGINPGDREWEANGICQSVTWPRTKYTISGKRDDGETIPGDYATGQIEERKLSRSYRGMSYVNFDALCSENLTTKKSVRAAFAQTIGYPKSKVTGDEAYLLDEDESVAVLFDPATLNEFIDEGKEYADSIEVVYLPYKSATELTKAKDLIDKMWPPLTKSIEKLLPISQGFHENAEYFRLNFLDPHTIARGEAFESILPILWLMSGANGAREGSRGSQPWFIPKANSFAVLLKESHFKDFRKEVSRHKTITHVFLVTDSEDAFRDMASHLTGYSCVILYKSYLNTFRINMLKTYEA